MTAVSEKMLWSSLIIIFGTLSFVTKGIHTYTHPFNGPLSGTTRVSWYQKGKTIWILLKQETVSGSGISWVVCKSAPRSRQITMPAPHHSNFLQTGCPSCRPTNSTKALKAVAALLKAWKANSHHWKKARDLRHDHTNCDQRCDRCRNGNTHCSRHSKENTIQASINHFILLHATLHASSLQMLVI